MTGPHVSAISTSSALLAGGGKISKKLANIERDENPPMSLKDVQMMTSGTP